MSLLAIGLVAAVVGVVLGSIAGRAIVSGWIKPKVIPEDRYKPSPPKEMGRGLVWEDPYEHVDGVWWHDAKNPFWVHRCWVQTRGTVTGTYVERCACGATRLDHGRFWFGRNESNKYAWKKRWRAFKAVLRPGAGSMK